MIIDGTDLILGRLASFAAKKSLLGEEIVIVNSENVMITGSKKNVLDNYKRKISRGSVRWGPFFPRTSERILRRTIRGMLPYKKDRGRKAYKKIKCFIGIPDKYKDNVGTIPQINISKVKNLKYISLSQISKELGVKV